jgi:hypothetical protein
MRKRTMFENLKKSILDNEFIYSLRLKFVVDQAEYDRLVRDLKLLVDIWKSESTIDKELMAVLYVLPWVVEYQAARPEYDSAVRQRLVDIRLELDALILQCLSD